MTRRLGLVVLASRPSANGGTVHLASGSPVEFLGDASINAANEKGLGGGGVDGAFNRKGGDAFETGRLGMAPIDASGRRIRTGEARSSPGLLGGLKMKHVVHAVGPDYNRCSEETGDALLASAYAAAVGEASRLGCATVASTLISSGVYRGRRPLKEIFRITVETLVSNTPSGMEVFLCAFSDEDVRGLRPWFQQDSGS